MSEAASELKSLLDELRSLADESGATSLSELVTREAQVWFPGGQSAPLPLEKPAAVALMVTAALRWGLDARRSAASLDRQELERKAQRFAQPVDGSRAAEHARAELERIKAKVAADVTAFNDDLGKELPLIVREASVDDLKRHFPSFVEQVFERWLQAELAELESELSAVAQQSEALARESGANRPSILPELGTRALEVDSFPRDFGVFALSTVGIAVLFSNALLGGALLVLAPFVARYGRERNEADLRERAALEAARAAREASERLAADLGKRIDGFGEELETLVFANSAPARRGVGEMLEAALRERDTESDDPGRCQDWQQRLSGLVARLEALKLGSQGERTTS